jgi:hypothetical protein
MATIPGAVLLAASSPYARRGELWNSYRRFYGQDDALALVWHATTRQMNPTISERIVVEAIERDPDGARAEYLAEFRSDIEGFVDREVVEALVHHGRYELPPQSDICYSAFVDVSGGQSDAFTWCIGHLDGETVVADLIREVRPPFSPATVTGEAAVDFQRYNVSTTTGDFYGAQWTAERFRECGITYTKAKKPKSTVYLELLPLLMSGRIELLDHPRSIHQLCALERRRHRGGKDVVDHSPGGADDCANALAGMAVHLTAVAPPAFWRLEQIPVLQ